jgi:putative ABC transport system permease protein
MSPGEGNATGRTSQIENFLLDLRYAARVLYKDRLFTAVSVLTLALGIGANTTMFSVVNAVLLRPLPGYETGRLVQINNADPRYRAGFLPPPLYEAIKKQSHSFESVAGLQFCPFNLTGVGDAEQVAGPCTTANWFALQHAGALLGRTFAPDEGQHGHARVVVLDHAFWKRKFNGAPNVIGRAILLNGSPWTIIGVMPADFSPLGVSGRPSIYTPDVIEDNPAGLIVMARLQPSASMDAARAELKLLGDRLARSDPGKWKGTYLTLTPALEQLTGSQRPLLVLLMGAVCFVLLIACTNVSNLLLARSKARQQEIQIRIALGASRRRIIQFLLTEVLLLCSVASVMAVGIAYLGLLGLRPLLTYLPRAEEISIDGRVFVWALIAGWLATLLAGALPALRSAQLRDVSGMRARSTLGWQTSLLAGEVALTLLLLISAGLLIRSFVNLRNAPLGYDPRNTLTSFLALPENAYSPASAELIYNRIRQRLAPLPGVRSVATATSTPTGGVDMSVEVKPEGVVPRRGDPTATVNIVSPDYFRTLGIRIAAGRAFSSADRHGAPPVAMISESIAKRYFHGNAVGRRIRAPVVNFALTHAKVVWAEVVGVAETVSVTSPGDRTAEHLYIPEAQSPVRFTYILVRTDHDPAALIAVVRHVVHAESPITPLDEVKTLEDRASYLTASPRRAMWLLGLFAAIAGILSASGIYGVSAYLAAQRKREIAIRMAVGASTLSLARSICRKPMTSIFLGMLLGIACAMALTRFLQSLLFGVANVDVFTYVAASGALLVAAVTAMVAPTARAVVMDVAITLRQE